MEFMRDFRDRVAANLAVFRAMTKAAFGLFLAVYVLSIVLRGWDAYGGVAFIAASPWVLLIAIALALKAYVHLGEEASAACMVIESMSVRYRIVSDNQRQ